LTTLLRFGRNAGAALLMLALVLQGTTSVLAGTTGAISGDVADASTNKPIAGARVSAVSPSQSSTTTTDASGRFSFVSLAPDTYTIGVAASAAYDAASISGVTVQADQNVTVNLAPPAKLKQIGSVTSRAAGALVKPGTTADVYSINAVTQDKASGVGGGGNLNSAWSAISTVPGVYVATSQAGYIGAAATLSIRGGDYDQIGYELDGVPVNRSFDNYPSSALSSLGQQELQVYTGATPANSEASGISGYINQVIRAGTAPASRNLTLAIGAPTMYNKIAFEAGGANPARTFSYYLGAGAYNQNFRYYDQFNGASLRDVWGTALENCPSAAPIGCHGPHGEDYTNGGKSNAFAWALGPYSAFSTFVPTVRDRDTIVNLHFGIPRKDGNRDDVQLLFDNNFIDNFGPTSLNDQGGVAFLNSIGAPTNYLDSFTFNGAALGTLLPGSYSGGGVAPYYYPDGPVGRPFNPYVVNAGGNGVQVPPDHRDAFVNNQSILKLQYQRNFGTNAFLRVYGYTYYSDWLQNALNSATQNNLGFAPTQYLLDSHTRGVSATFTDQVTSQHLLSFQGSYTTATTLRDNNKTVNNGYTYTLQQGAGLYGPLTLNQYTVVGMLVNGNDPYSGVCYTPAGAPVGCYNAGGTAPNRNAGHFNLNQAAGLLGTSVTPASGTCGTGPCQYLVVGNGVAATYNTVIPKFSSFSLTDQWKPTDRLNFNLGLRYDIFSYQGSDTTNGGLARTFWYNAWNHQFPSTPQFNVSAQSETFSVLQPRLGVTYTADPRTVLRASYGRYAQASNSAFEQYNFLQPIAPVGLAGFLALGVGNTPMHAIRPAVSNNYDFSVEHQFQGDTSVKITPFLRKTRDQVQQFYLDQRTAFVSGLNVGQQTSEGVELEVDKGDFARNGLAGRLTFAYTNSYINYSPVNGHSVVDPINAAIQGYNAYTGFCAAHAGDARCGATQTGAASAPCYDNAGGAQPGCGAGTIANPYWNAPVQPLLDPNANYPTFSLFPGGAPGAGGYFTYGAPFVATLMLQYKHGPLAVTPALQFSGGARYGVPLSTPGISPDQCTGGLSTSTGGDPRYPYGAPGGAPFDATACTQGIAIPDPFTKRFDGVGAFVAPSSLLLHTQITYDVNKRLTLVGNFANIMNRCFGGTKVPFAVGNACGYTSPPQFGGGNSIYGNAYNPGWALQPQSATPYFPLFAGFPFNMYFEARIKI
jgi:TonB dependent receptor/Carboxypeptidase regulatory-like domain/TonB-dependent Receptor Plug Domain